MHELIRATVIAHYNVCGQNLGDFGVEQKIIPIMPSMEKNTTRKRYRVYRDFYLLAQTGLKYMSKEKKRQIKGERSNHSTSSWNRSVSYTHSFTIIEIKAERDLTLFKTPSFYMVQCMHQPMRVGTTFVCNDGYTVEWG